MRSLIGTMIAALLLCPVVLAQEMAMEREEPAEAARAALDTFGRLVSEENYAQLGFDSPREVQQAELGEPLMEYMIRLDALQGYQEGSDPEELLVPTQQLIYPVVVGGKVRSAVTLSKASGEWKVVGFGKPMLARLLDEQRSSLESARGTAATPAFAVRIPALNVYFLGTREDSRLLFTPLFDDSRIDLKKGEAVPAGEVLQRLAPIARELEDVPT